MIQKEFVDSCILKTKYGSSMCCQTEYLCHLRKQEKWPERAWLEHAECSGRRAKVQCSVPGHFLYAHSTGRKGRPYVKTWLFMEYGSLSKFTYLLQEKD